MKDATKSKFDDIRNFLSGKRILVAFSGGVDSTVLAHIAKNCVSEIALLTIVSPTVPESEVLDARAVAKELGLELKEESVKWLEVSNLSENPVDRCYTCKRALADLWLEYAQKLGFDTVIEGTTATETEGYRPGLAALKESGVDSPYLKAGVTKAEIREYARENGLSIAEKPSGACLASRFPYGTEITHERLTMVATVEEKVREIFGVECVRARFHGDLVRVEVGTEELSKMYDPEKLQQLDTAAKDAGFTYVTLDLQGYRTGAMDEVFST
ncbi:MAG: ATP-dependent sacrificial sulfur transferase LarE [Candidatus Thorarchaeota archaeon]